MAGLLENPRKYYREFSSRMIRNCPHLIDRFVGWTTRDDYLHHAQYGEALEISSLLLKR